MSEVHENPWTPAGNVGAAPPPAPPSERPSYGASQSRIAAIGILVAVALLLLGAAITGFSFDEISDDGGWKLTVKVLGLSTSGFFGFNSATALFVGIALLFAARLASPDGTAAPGIGVGIALLAGYLLVITLIGLYVDIDALTADGNDRTGEIMGVLVADLGVTVMLAIATWSGARLQSTR